MIGLQSRCWARMGAVTFLPARRGSCHDFKVKTLTLLSCLLVLPLHALAADCPKSQPKTESALLEVEHHWADALTRKDADAVACILAAEFEDADVDGTLHSRAEALARIPQRKPWTNRLTAMYAHLNGDSAFVRGLNEVLDQNGKVIARVRFTDIFTYREGRWQALAGQETLLGEAHR